VDIQVRTSTPKEDEESKMKKEEERPVKSVAKEVPDAGSDRMDIGRVYLICGQCGAGGSRAPDPNPCRKQTGVHVVGQGPSTHQVQLMFQE
jgi:hypothetical protein